MLTGYIDIAERRLVSNQTAAAKSTITDTLSLLMTPTVNTNSKHQPW